MVERPHSKFTYGSAKGRTNSFKEKKNYYYIILYYYLLCKFLERGHFLMAKDGKIKKKSQSLFGVQMSLIKKKKKKCRL